MTKFMFVEESNDGTGFSLETEEYKMTTPWLTLVDDQDGTVTITQKENLISRTKPVSFSIQYCDIPQLWAMLGEWLAQEGGVPKRYVQFSFEEDC